MNEKAIKIRPFGWRDKVGYMIGNVANDFTFIFASLFLQIFYTDVLGINAGLVGTMFLLARIVDAVTDTVMGRIADRARAGRAGKFKPWLLRFCGPVALASFLMYQSSVAAAPMALKVAYMFVTYLLWGSICYTAINIPYGSMASVISGEADHRSALSTFRGVGSIIPQIAVGVILPAFLYTTREDGTKTVNASVFPIAALLLSIASVICYLICYFMCTERVNLHENTRKMPLGRSIKTLFSNRSLVAICMVYVFFLAAQMLSQTINNYIFKDYFASSAGFSVMNAVGFVPILVLSPFAVPLSRKFGKKAIGIFASVLGTVSCALLFLLKTKNMWVYIGVNIVGLFGFGLFNLIVWAFISDVIDDCELRSGERQDGIIYAVCSFSRKLGQAIASALGGWTLAWIGYVEGASTAQSESVKSGIYNVATAVPALLYLLVAITLIFMYPLGKHKVMQNTMALKQRNGGDDIE